MGYFAQAASEAFHLIISADPEIKTVTWASLRFSLTSTILASIVGIPAGVALVFMQFQLKKIFMALLNTLLALPTVVVGLFVYAFICRQGPLGYFGFLFSPIAIIIGQTILIIPIICVLTYSGVKSVNPVVRATALTLGAKPWRANVSVLAEAKGSVFAACVTAFGRVIGEVGISMMLGGNIAGYTRTITTVIALETSKGEFALGLALGIILLAVAFIVNFSIRLLGGLKI